MPEICSHRGKLLGLRDGVLVPYRESESCSQFDSVLVVLVEEVVPPPRQSTRALRLHGVQKSSTQQIEPNPVLEIYDIPCSDLTWYLALIHLFLSFSNCTISWSDSALGFDEMGSNWSVVHCFQSVMLSCVALAGVLHEEEYERFANAEARKPTGVKSNEAWVCVWTVFAGFSQLWGRWTNWLMWFMLESWAMMNLNVINASCLVVT